MNIVPEGIYILVTMTQTNGQERAFWLSPNQDILEDNNLLDFVDLIRDANLKDIFNWKDFLKKPNYGFRANSSSVPFIQVLSSKFGTFKIKKMIAEERLKIERFSYNDLGLEKQAVPYVTFKIQTKDGTYLINKDYSLTNLLDITSKANSLNFDTEFPFIWDDPDLNYTLTNSYVPLLQTKDINKIELICDVFKQAQLANPKILKNPIRAASSMNEEINDMLRTFNDSLPHLIYIQYSKTFKEFSSEFKKDWGTYIDAYGNKISRTPSYNHKEFKLNDNVTDFEEFLIMVYDYLSQSNYVIDRRYSMYGATIDSIVTTFGKYLLKNPDFFASKFLNQQINDIIAEFKKRNFTIDINFLIRKFYKNKKACKIYYRMFIDYYVKNYIKPDIEKGIDVCKKYGITSNNLSTIILEVAH